MEGDSTPVGPRSIPANREELRSGFASLAPVVSLSASPVGTPLREPRAVSRASAPPSITILVCTYNRADDLSALLASILAQEFDTSTEVEVLVVDNNSKDRTPEVVRELMVSGHDQLRYIAEPRQGKGYALNSGLAAASGELLAVVDDDQLMPPRYLNSLIRAFDENPTVAFVGGKVLPLWEKTPPTWLTPSDWAPIGMADYGDESFVVDERRPVCLLTCAFRRVAFDAVGGFRAELGVTGAGGIGGIEDAEIQERLWQSGRPGLYVPELVLMHRAPARRLTRAHYRRWHMGHGRFSAILTDQASEHFAARLFDVPAVMYRKALSDIQAYAACLLRGDSGGAFRYEGQLRFFAGFFRQRFRDHRAARSRGIVRELRNFVVSVARKQP